MDMVYIVSIWLLPVLIAITFHEAAHGYVARDRLREDARWTYGVPIPPIAPVPTARPLAPPDLVLRDVQAIVVEDPVKEAAN
jgi:hypothetical protein